MEWTANKNTAELDKHTNIKDFKLKLAADCTATIEGEPSDNETAKDDSVVQAFNAMAIIVTVVFVNV